MAQVQLYWSSSFFINEVHVLFYVFKTIILSFNVTFVRFLSTIKLFFLRILLKSDEPFDFIHYSCFSLYSILFIFAPLEFSYSTLQITV